MNIEVFYTGGGIWLAETIINDKGDYAVVGNDFPEILSLYHESEFEEEKYMPEDMYFSEPVDKLDPDLRAIHEKMVLELQKKAW